jgi:very-short-patch-repair endonuclease
MRGFHPDVAAILDVRGVIARRQHRELARSIDRMIAAGKLIAVLPGVYARPPGTGLTTRMAAIMAWNPDAVLVGAAAARAWFWQDISCPIVEVAVSRCPEFDRPGIRFAKRRIPPELVAECWGLRMTVPALTAVDLCTELGGDAIDVALRSRAATLDDMWLALALTPDRPGNKLRHELLHESRSSPWSPPERRFHRLLRAAGITGWDGNVAVRGPNWRCQVDVAFEAEKLAAEVDGRAHHNTAAAFEKDHVRQNRLVLAGWTILRFTPTMIDNDPDGVIAAVQEALAQLRGRRASRRR